METNRDQIRTTNRQQCQNITKLRTIIESLLNLLKIKVHTYMYTHVRVHA